MGKFETYLDLTAKWRWRLLADNGYIVADSAEGYESKYNVDRAIHLVKIIAPSAEISVA